MSDCEKNVKIGQYIVTIWTKVCDLLFLATLSKDSSRGLTPTLHSHPVAYIYRKYWVTEYGSGKKKGFWRPHQTVK